MPTPAATPQRDWHVACHANPVIRDWNGDFLAYHPLSGHSHILDWIAGAVLTAVSQQPRSASWLCAHVAALLEVVNDAALASRVKEILDHLDDCGLLEPDTT